MARRALRLLISLTGVALLTYAGYTLFPVNATTQGFAYLLLVLIIASSWDFWRPVPATIKAAAIALETEMLEQKQKRETQLYASAKTALV